MALVELASSERRVVERPDSNGEVDAFFDEVDAAIGERQLEPQARVAAQKPCNDRCQKTPPVQHWSRDPQ